MNFRVKRRTDGRQRGALRDSHEVRLKALQLIWRLGKDSSHAEIKRAVSAVAALSQPQDFLRCISDQTGVGIETVEKQYRTVRRKGDDVAHLDAA